MSDIVATCAFCRDDITDTDGGVMWQANNLYCSSWCAQNSKDEKLKLSNQTYLKNDDT